LNKCAFDLKEIDYLRFIVEVNDICINFAKIAIITKWVESTTRQHVRAFLKFAKFYKKFIKKFNKIVKSLTNLFKERRKEKFDKKFKLTKKTRIAFEQLKEVFIKASILLHFDSKRKIRLKIDAFDFAISEILFQLIKETSQWHFVAFFFSKDVRCEAKLWNRRNWNTRRDQIVSCFSTLYWRRTVFCSSVDWSR
jgi:hypothetical protein